MAPKINIYIYVNGDLLSSRTSSTTVHRKICHNSFFKLIMFA